MPWMEHGRRLHTWSVRWNEIGTKLRAFLCNKLGRNWVKRCCGSSFACVNSIWRSWDWRQPTLLTQSRHAWLTVITMHREILINTQHWLMTDCFSAMLLDVMSWQAYKRICIGMQLQSHAPTRWSYAKTSVNSFEGRLSD